MAKKSNTKEEISYQEKKDKLLEAILQNVVFDGWEASDLVEISAEMADVDKDFAAKAFDDGVLDIMDYWGDWLNRQMLERIKEERLISLRVRSLQRSCPQCPSISGAPGSCTQWPEVFMACGRSYLV